MSLIIKSLQLLRVKAGLFLSGLSFKREVYSGVKWRKIVHQNPGPLAIGRSPNEISSQEYPFQFLSAGIQIAQ
jgi:hypothetical protein